MKALVKTEPGYNKMKLLEIEKPVPRDQEVLIKVIYTGICGTDIHGFKGEYDRLKTPLVLGHEFSGVVEAIGENVTKVQKGALVTSETTFATCGECEPCQNKEYNLCLNRKGLGSQVNGSFAEYVLTREESVHVLDDKISLLAASITEPIACGVHASMEKVQVEKNDVAVIVGPGPIGLCLSQVLKSVGAKVIVIGITQDAGRLETARELGADRIIDSLKEDAAGIIKEFTNGKGADYCFECSGAAPAIKGVFDYLKQKGILVQMGVFAKNLNELDMNSIVQREMNVIGSRSQKPSTWHLTLDLMKKGQIDAERLITKIYPLEQWEDAIEQVMAGNEIKVVLQPNKQ
ncbi:sorbitol dehydrogenase [Enterococcus avium]|uniref:zinc-dependent alcohol dehydrogenase n=1 Tax=Enterococcus malodoratus TaxID=71451 RepID=UPI0008BCAB75|nr:zinc-binding dehydrogenase [Enterococcus malodoratus]BBM19625.1 sorbitol dehydrogenase [Enterococcus avium]SET85282.1 L-iditol 2-dehydrogenase [Enterococcus malodoratus]